MFNAKVIKMMVYSTVKTDNKLYLKVFRLSWERVPGENIMVSYNAHETKSCLGKIGRPL
jgi:hypothetical protein